MAEAVTFFELRDVPHHPGKPRYFADDLDTIVNSVRISWSKHVDKLDIRAAMVGNHWHVYVDGVERMKIIQHDGVKLEKPEHL